MIRSGEIQSIATRLGIRDTQIEKDYAISWVLYGMSQNRYFKDHLVFKGGTVLRKAYFPGYRFSEDLDFTFTGGDFSIDEIHEALERIIESVYIQSRIRLSIKNPVQYSTGNFNCYISYIGPLGGTGAQKDIKFDASSDEILFDTPERKKIINEYSDLRDEDLSLICYTVKEVIGEKMRSLMQRSASRDLYDLWYLFENEGYIIEDCISCFQEKAAHKGYNSKEFVRTVLQKEKIFFRQWELHLANQMSVIPDFKKVWRDLGRHWRKFEKLTLES